MTQEPAQHPDTRLLADMEDLLTARQWADLERLLSEGWIGASSQAEPIHPERPA